jgi:hypothetical protein
LTWLITAFAWLSVLLLIVPIAGEPDIWGHLRFGLDVLATGEVPSRDPYTFTQDQPMIYHEWLSGLIMALFYTVAGVPGLVLLKLCVMTTTFLILWRTWRPVDPIITWGALVLTASAAAPIVRTTRPHMWTLLFLLTMLVLVKEKPNAWRLVAIAAIYVAWANLHGGVILGLGVLGLWCVVSAALSWKRGFPDFAWWFAPPVVALAATLVNPYGVDLWRFLLGTVRPNRDIADWLPLWHHVYQLWLPFAIAVAIVIALRLWPAWPATAVMVMLWYGGVSVSRIAALAVPVTMLVVASRAAERWPRKRRVWRVNSRAAAAFMTVPLIAAAVTVAPFIREPFTCIPIGDQDAAGLARLKATSGEGRLVVWFTWGQYALWHVSPRLKVSWDGRRETLYSEAAQETQKAVAFGRKEGDEWLTRVRPEYVWLPSNFVARGDWLVANGYRLDHVSDESFIAVREDLPPLPEAVPLEPCVALP